MSAETETDIPAEKDPTDYTYQERRADIVEQYGEAGPMTAEIAALRYGVSKSVIKRDLQAIRE